MSEERDRNEAGADPEDRAFSGDADGPPAEPDQPPRGNRELERPKAEGEGEPGEAGGANPHGDYTELPGYGG